MREGEGKKRREMEVGITEEGESWREGERDKERQ